FFGKKGCEISECSYTPEGLRGGRKSLRVVLIRTKLEEKQRDLFGERYRHYALVSNIGQHEKVPVMKKKKMRGKRGAIRKKAEGYEWMSATSENIVKFYRSRGNTENFIKEEKYGLDLKHYPCKKLSANKVFGLVGAMAYNLMRLSSFLISKRGCYSKKIRLTLLRRPCQVVSHARRLTLRFNREIAKEVRRNREHLKKMFGRISDTS
ncbi:MAG: transposase, partial [Bacteriovoracales bacterium]|nr:transposase [Bacteriovoracales bacterium]